MCYLPPSPTAHRHPLLSSLRALVIVAALVLTGGCANYTLGPTNGRKSGDTSIKIAPVQNDTIEPRLSEAVGNALRKQIQQDGTFRLETQDEAGILVTSRILRLERTYLSLNPRDVITPRDYQMILTMQLQATERGTGKVLVDRPLSGRTTVRVGTDVNSAERESIPLLAEVIARKATSVLADGDW